MSLTYTYSLFKTDRFEAGFGLGVSHLRSCRPKVVSPARSTTTRTTEAGIFPTGALNFAWRISRRWAFTARHNQLKLIGDDPHDGKYQDSHADVQFRWRTNFAVGLGYTQASRSISMRVDVDEPFLFDLETTGPELFFRASF